MNAKYQGTCHLCEQSIEVGDEIQRSNGQRRHASFVHLACIPAAGVLSRARFAVSVTVADENGWIPVGVRKRYVHRSMADSVAAQLRNLGATVEVVPL